MGVRLLKNEGKQYTERSEEQFRSSLVSDKMVFLYAYLIKVALDRFFPTTYLNSYEGLLQAIKREITANKERIINMILSKDSYQLDLKCEFLEKILGLAFVPTRVKINIIEFLLSQELPDNSVMGTLVFSNLNSALKQALKLDISERERIAIKAFIAKLQLAELRNRMVAF